MLSVVKRKTLQVKMDIIEIIFNNLDWSLLFV